jgi:hypothetical protein
LVAGVPVSAPSAGVATHQGSNRCWSPQPKICALSDVKLRQTAAVFEHFSILDDLRVYGFSTLDDPQVYFFQKSKLVLFSKSHLRNSSTRKSANLPSNGA